LVRRLKARLRISPSWGSRNQDDRRRVRLWITAFLSIAATALIVGLTVAAQAGVHHAHTRPPLAGIILNALD